MNSFKTHLEKLQLLITQLSPSIICLQETNFKGHYAHPIKGYQVFHKNRTDRNTASGGVAVYIQNKHDVIQIPVTTHLEAVAVSIQYADLKLSLINV